MLPNLDTLVKPAGIIVNTDSQYEEGEHWLAIYIPIYGAIEYFDSLGLPIYIKEIQDFVGPVYKLNNKLVQYLLSSTCGQYCMFFLYMKSIGKKFDNIMSVFTEDKRFNDRMVNDTVESIFSTDLDIFNIPFMYKQISNILKNTKYWQNHTIHNKQ